MSTTRTTATDLKQHTRVISEAELKYSSTFGVVMGKVKATYSLMITYGISYKYASVCLDYKLDPSTALISRPELFI